MLEPAVTIAPSSLQFPLAVNKKITQHLILSHNGATALTFKVKTTSPARYGVRPPRGILPPGSEQHVAITLRAQPLLPPDALDCQDRFKVFLMPLGDESHERSLSPDSRARFLAELWDSEETAKKATIHKIKCSFTPDGVPSDGALARRGEGLRADERAPSEGASCDAGNARSACSCSRSPTPYQQRRPHGLRMNPLLAPPLAPPLAQPVAALPRGESLRAASPKRAAV